VHHRRRLSPRRLWRAGQHPLLRAVGVLAASLFAVSNAFRGEYRLANFFAFRPHGRRTVRLWNVTFVCLLVLGFLAQISVGYSRGWIVLFYIATFAGLIVLRFAIVRLTALARSAGLISAQRIFLIGTGAHVGAFVHRYEPWTLGASVVGCRFLTPTAATALAQERWATLERDLAEAVAGVRSLEPDAIFLLMPWSATEIIERCAETFLALPVEIHLGPEQILHKFETVELSRLGTLASLQPTRMPLSRLEIAQKRLFDLVFAAAGLLALTPLLVLVAILIRIDSPGPVFFVYQRFPNENGINKGFLGIIASQFRPLEAHGKQSACLLPQDSTCAQNAQRPRSEPPRTPLATTHLRRARHDRLRQYQKTSGIPPWPVHSHTRNGRIMSKLSRRSLVAGAAALPALPAPAAAAAIAPTAFANIGHTIGDWSRAAQK
jgi:hypothetical protein